MAYRRSNTMYDAMMSGISNLGGIADVVNGAKKQESELKLRAAQLKESEQNQSLNQQKIDTNKETMAQALARRQLMESMESAGELAPKAMAGTPTANGNAVDFQDVKRSRQLDRDAKAWNQWNQDKPGFVPMSGEKRRAQFEADTLKGAQADQADVLTDERATETHQSKMANDKAARETGRYTPVPLGGDRLGAMNTRTGKIADTGESTPPKLVGGKTTQEKHDEGVFKAKDKLRDAYEKSGTANAIIMLNDISAKIGGVDGTGDVAGYGKTGLTPQFLLSQEGKDVRTSLAGLRNIVLKDRSGAAVTNQEFERLKEEIGGGVFSDDKDLRSKLNRMGEIVAQHAQNIDATFDGDPDVPREAFDQYRKAGGTTGGSLNLKAKPAASAAGSKFKILSVED